MSMATNELETDEERAADLKTCGEAAIAQAKTYTSVDQVVKLLGSLAGQVEYWRHQPGRMLALIKSAAGNAMAAKAWLLLERRSPEDRAQIKAAILGMKDAYAEAKRIVKEHYGLASR